MYKFTPEQDWFSHCIPTFQQYLSRYIGKSADFLECGSHEGRSAIWMLENILTHPLSTLTCIDPWPIEQARQTFKFNIIEGMFDGKVKALHDKSNIMLKTLYVGSANIYDFIFIDGEHYGYGPLEDAVLAFPLLKIGGLICFDDYTWDKTPTITKCIDSFIECYRQYIKIVHHGYQVWVEKIGEMA